MSDAGAHAGATSCLRKLRPPALHLNPSDDEAFAGVVARLFNGGLRDAGEFQRRLRATYPGALVRPRDLAHEPFVSGTCTATGDGSRPRSRCRRLPVPENRPSRLRTLSEASRPAFGQTA